MVGLTKYEETIALLLMKGWSLDDEDEDEVLNDIIDKIELKL